MNDRKLPDDWILRLLASKGTLAPEQAEQIRSEETVCAFAALLRKGLATQSTVARAVREQYGVAFADPAASCLDRRALALVPEAMCSRFLMVPLKADGDSLHLLMVNPLDQAAQEAAAAVSGRNPVPFFGVADSVRALIAEGYGSEAVIFDLLRKLPQAEGVEVIGSAAGEAEANSKAEVSAPVIELANSLIAQAVRMRASDIHIEHDERTTTVRFRVDGDLRSILMLPRSVGEGPLVSRIKIMANLDIADRRRPQDGRAMLRVGGQEVGLRVSTLPTAFGEKAVLRILEQKGAAVSLEAMGFRPEVLARIEGMAGSGQGIVLVTGPTGSGKTTTLYSLLNRLRSVTTNIVTVEDPIEYRMEGINQVQVHEKAGLTFASILRSVLRQDPDVVLVGEIRDRETADIAFQAALTGHLVMSTLHTNSALLTVSRLMDMGVEAYKMAPAFVGVVSQRLARRVCPSCRVAGEDGTFRGAGCDACGGTGALGRIALAEVLDLRDPGARELLQKGDLADFRREALAKKWLLPLAEDVQWHLDQGDITAEEAAAWLEAPAARTFPPPGGRDKAPRVEGDRMPERGPDAPRRVLVVDDNPDNRSIALTVLSREGYHVNAAADGLLGLAEVVRDRPDLILLDIMMPGLDGFGFLKRLRGEMGLTDIPVLVLSAMGEAESQVLALELGADDYLTKPFNPTILKVRVKALFRRMATSTPPEPACMT